MDGQTLSVGIVAGSLLFIANVELFLVNQKKPTMKATGNMKKIFCDIDEPLADFLGAANTFYGVDIPKADIVKWELPYERYGKTHNTFWDDLTEDFWRNMPKQPWCDELIDFFESQDGYSVCLLTAPAYRNATGKQRWIRKNLPKFYDEKRYLIGPAKSFCAGPDSILIDDREKNCEDFIKWGGQAIVFPAPWNSWGDWNGSPVIEAVKIRFDTIRSELLMAETCICKYPDSSAYWSDCPVHGI